MKIFLYGIKNFGNLAMILRSIEHFGITTCYVCNERSHQRNPEQGGVQDIQSDFNSYPKGLKRRLVRISSGAILKVAVEIVSDYEAFFSNYPGRVVAARLSTTATAIYNFQFQPDDCIVFGCEAWGLPDHVLAHATQGVMIPSAGATQSLNLAIAVSIFVYEATKTLPPQTQSLVTNLKLKNL